MIWAAPWAWALALAAMLPIAAHLWSQRRPVALPFPTLRFLHAASPVSRRLRRIHEWPLLLIRVAVVAAICAAAAGPTLVSTWRREAWRLRLHRVIVVDGDVAAQAAPVTATLRQEATSWSTIEQGSLSDRLDEAIARASTHAAGMRTEIVVVWDGSHAALSPHDLDAVPAAVGLRLVVADKAAPDHATASARSGAQPPSIAIRAAAADAERRERLLTALPGIAAGAVPTPVEILWPGAQRAVAPSGEVDPGLIGVLDAIADDARVRDAAERSLVDRRSAASGDSASGRPARDGGSRPSGARVDVLGGRWLARTADGLPLLRGWGDGQRLVLALEASPASPLAWWSAVAALEAIGEPWRGSARADRWSTTEVDRANRAPSVPAATSLPGGLDTRAAWGVALALLLLEQWWRRRSPVGDIEVIDAA